MRIEEEDDRQKESAMDSPVRISAAAADPDKNNTARDKDEVAVEEDDFEFSFIQIPESGPPIAADDIFSNGMILPIYPLFNRDLLLGTNINSSSSSADFTDIEQIEKEKEEESKSSRQPLRRLFIEEEREQASFSSSSSSASSSQDELDGIPPGTYCVWNPNQDRCKKSNSTGSTPSSSLRWKLKDLVVGRNKSDGKEKFVFIPMIERAAAENQEIGTRRKGDEEENNNSKNNKGSKLGMNKPSPREVDVVTAQQRMTMTYGGQDVGKAAGRKSYLPYKRNLVGLFNLNGLTRGQDPF